MQTRFERSFFLLIIFCSLFAGGCAKRPSAPPVKADTAVEAAIPAEPSPSPVPSFTVSYYLGETLLTREEVPYDSTAAQIPSLDGVRLLGWTDAQGVPADPLSIPVHTDTVYYALTRPLLNEDAPFLFPEAHGFLLPNAEFTYADAAAALRSLLADASDCRELLDRYDSAPDEPMSIDELRSMLSALFLPEQAEEVTAELSEHIVELTRAGAAWCYAGLAEKSSDTENYYPDVSPANWAFRELSEVSAPGPLDRDTLMNQTLDGFLWFDGYLYRLDSDGFFITDETADDLYYGVNGRYSSGDETLDNFVAQTLSGYMEPDRTRRDLLRAAYLHVKNDFNYLVRNYYASGETGWAIPEAITMYETGKGNCYNYAGVFWSLARGLGYNAVTYSGTMGNQNQPHAWTEITLDGEIYICDPEIEMNYWWLAALNNDNSMYTDNFMMPRRSAGNWNYQAVGRQ